MAYSPDGKWLATARSDGIVKMWDAATGQETLTLKGHTGCLYDVAFSPDGKRFASASDDGTAKVWDATTGLEVLTLKGHGGMVSGVAFSPDGQRLASAGPDGLKLWDARPLEPEAKKPGPTPARVRPRSNARLARLLGPIPLRETSDPSSWHHLRINGHILDRYAGGQRAAGGPRTAERWTPCPVTARGMRPGHQECLMISSNGFIVATLSLYALLGAVGVAWEVRARRKAGPIRFRLPLASMAKPPRIPAWCKILVVLGMLMVISAALIGGTPTDLVTLTFCLWIVAGNLQAVHPRRQTIRWLVLAAGLLVLANAAMCLAIGLGVFHGSLFRMPPWVMLILSPALLAGGAVTIWEGLSGTVVSEHGLEILRRDSSLAADCRQGLARM